MELVKSYNKILDINKIKNLNNLSPSNITIKLEKFLVKSRKSLHYLNKKIKNNNKESIFLVSDLICLYGNFDHVGVVSSLGLIKKAIFLNKFTEAFDQMIRVLPLIKSIDDQVLNYINNELLKKNKTILVIEDDKMLSLVINKRLESENYSVDLAQNGLDGLELLNQRKYSLVITDIKMPFVSGAEVVSFIKNKLIYQTNVIATSVRVDDLEVRKSIANGADYFLKKPLNLNELIYNVNKFVA